jgi:hypothetical protein
MMGAKKFFMDIEMEFTIQSKGFLDFNRFE